MNDLAERLRKAFHDEEYRYSYADSLLNSWIAAQIKVLREQRGLTQAELAERIGTKQAGVSRLENVNYSSWKTDTLRKIARALGVRLKISFEAFGTVLDDAAHFGKDHLRRPEFADDPVFFPNAAQVNIPDAPADPFLVGVRHVPGQKSDDAEDRASPKSSARSPVQSSLFPFSARSPRNESDSSPAGPPLSVARDSRTDATQRDQHAAVS